MAYSWTMLDVLSLLGISTNPNKVEVRIDCPFCGKKHMDINQVKGVGQCWSESCRQGVDSVSLYAAYEGLSLADARAQIKERLGIDNHDNRNPKYPARIVYKSVINESQMADVDTRNNVYRAFLNELPLSEKNRTMLIARGFDEEDIETTMYRTLPSRDEIDFVALCTRMQKEGYNLAGIPGFFKLNSGYWTFVGMTKGILMPQIDRRNRIFGLQLRKDDDLRKYIEQIGEIEGKCCWFSSKSCKNGCGAKASESVHYACDFKYSEGMYSPILKDTIMLTEGSMKADLIHSFLRDAPVVSIPGVKILTAIENDIGYWRERGVKRILLCFDMDYKTNQDVQLSLEKTKKLIECKGIEVIQRDWETDIEINGVKYNLKGLDDYMAFRLKGILPKIVSK